MNDVRVEDDELIRKSGLKKRKSNEDTSAATALLSLDRDGKSSPKRIRPSTPNTEARDLSGSVTTLSPEQRESADTTRHDSGYSSPSPTSRHSHVMENNNMMSPPKMLRMADSTELASAMALASLAHQSAPIIKPNPRPHYEVRGSYHSSRLENQMPNNMHTVPPIRMPSFNKDRQRHNMYPQHISHHDPHLISRQVPRYYNNMAYRYEYEPTPNYQVQRPPEKWACDYCSQGSFATYEQACNHEKICPYNPQRMMPAPNTCVPQPAFATRSASMTSVVSTGSKQSSAHASDFAFSPEDEDESKYFSGKIPLSVPDADPEWLSEMNCFIRHKCIEIFSAEEHDVIKSSKRGRISLKQVGIRCNFCKNEDYDQMAMSAVSFPVSSSGIYESVKRWTKIHYPLCKHIPAEVTDKISTLEKAPFVPTTRQYWIDSAKALGIEDTQSGLRFTHDVTNPKNAENASKALLGKRLPPSDESFTDEPHDDSSESNTKYIVFPEDDSVITPFLYALLRQVEKCQFTDADRYIARSRCPIGFTGFQCRHCSGHAGLGKYFPTSPKALSTNSTTQNIFSHLLKCRKCPDDLKERLKSLKYDKGRHWTRRTTGWRQKFFEQLWKRLHGKDALKIASRNGKSWNEKHI